MKLNYILILVILFIGGFFVSGCVSPDKAPSSNLYKNDIYGFSIEYPKNWETKNSVDVEGITAIVAFMGPIKNGFQTNINIKTESAEEYTLNQYIQVSKQVLSQLLAMNDYILIDEGSLTINNQNAYFLEYAWNFKGNPLKVKQVIFMNRNNAYIITFTSLQNAFEDSVIDFDNSVSTFKFTK